MPAMLVNTLTPVPNRAARTERVLGEIIVPRCCTLFSESSYRILWHNFGTNWAPSRVIHRYLANMLTFGLGTKWHVVIRSDMPTVESLTRHPKLESSYFSAFLGYKQALHCLVFCRVR